MGNFCCVDFQTNCKKSITIGYLKTLINGVIPIHTEADPKFANDDYCPTYDELTNGILVAQYVDGGIDHWGDNVDGIIVEGSYSANSIVGKEDAIFCYTMFGEANLIVDKTEFDACGDSTYLIVTCGFVKVTRRLSSDCENIETTTYGGDTGLTKSFYSTENWLTFSGMTAEAGKNGTVSSSTRTTDVICTVENRGETYSSNTVTITQDGLTGAYESVGTDILDNFTARPSTTDTFGCEGGVFSVDGKADVATRKNWIDECGVKYDDVYTESRRTEILQEENKFPEIECPTEEYRATSSLTISYSGVSSSFTFTQDCKQSCCRKTGYICTPECRQEETIDVDSCGDSGNFELDVESYCLDPLDREHTEPYYDYVVEWELLNGSGDLVQFSGRNNLTWTIKENCSHDALQNKATYARIIKPSGSSDVIQECIFNFIQESGRCETCPCDCGTLVLNPDDTEYYYTHMIGRDGGRFEYRYSSTPCSGNNRVEFVKRSDLDNWYTLEPTQRNGYIIKVDRRSSSASATAYIDIYVNGVKCDKEIKFQQQAGCQCEDGIIDLMQSIPASGLPSGATIGTYQITNDCDNNISFTGEYINAENGVITLTKEIEPNVHGQRTDVNIIKRVSYNSSIFPVECERYVIHQETFNCDCDDLDISSVQIPQSGLPANSIIGTYSISSAECEMIVELSSSDLSINYGNGQIITTNAIPENDGENAITYSISGKVGATSCGVTTLTQPGLECDCEDMTTSFSIPQSGIAANSQIGTYSFSNSDCLDKASFTSNDLNIAYNNGVITTINTIPANTDENAKSYTISGKVRTYDCTPIIVSQPGLACSCANMTQFGSTIVEVPRSGYTASTKIGEYAINEDCEQFLTVSSTDGLVLTKSSGNIMVSSISDNDSPSAKTYTISASVRGGEPCASFTITQEAGCNCADDLISFNTNQVPNSGASTSFVIGTYTIGSDCSSAVAFSSDTLNITYANGEIHPQNEIPRNTNDGSNEYAISAFVNSEYCETKIVSQPGLACDCGSVTINNTLNSIIPRSGYTAFTKIAEYTVSDGCDVHLSFSGNDNTNFIISSTTDSIYCKVSANTNTEEEEYVLTPYIDETACTTKAITYTQQAECDCTNVALTSTFVGDIPRSGFTNFTQIATYTISDNCDNKVNFVSSDNANFIISANSGNIYAKVTSIVGTTNSGETFSATAYVNGSICSHVEFVQEDDCQCSNIISVTPTVVGNIPGSGYTRYTKIGEYSTSENCNDAITVSGSSNDFTVSAANGSIFAIVSENNGNSAVTHTVSYSVYGSSACSSFTVNQDIYCDCEAFDGYDMPVASFPYSGVTNQPIMSVENNGRCFENIVVTVDPDDGGAQVTKTFENGVFRVLATIPGSDEFVEYNFGYGIDSLGICFESPIPKEPTPCSSIISSTTMPIAASGITDEVIATLKVSYNRYVREQDFSFSASSNELSINPSFNANNTIDLEGTVGAFRSDTASGRIFKINVIVKGVVCSTLTLFQNKFICECTDLVVTPSIATIPSTGLPINTQIATYEIGNEASGICLSAVSVTCESMSLNAINGSISLASRLPANTEASAITHTINVASDSNASVCTSITIVQEAAIVCDCSKALIVTKSIPSSGVPSGTSIARITARSPLDCGISNISLSGNNTTYGIRLSGLNPYSAITIDAIPANESEDINPFALSYNVGSAPCHVRIPQEGTDIKCSCESIDSFITATKTIFPLSGSGGQVLILSADTKGCGTLQISGTSQTMFDGGEVTVSALSDSKYEVYCTVLSSNTPYDSASINISFKNNEEEAYSGCTSVITIERNQYYFDCSDIWAWGFDQPNPFANFNEDLRPINYLGDLKIKIWNENDYFGDDYRRFIIDNVKALVTISNGSETITYTSRTDTHYHFSNNGSTIALWFEDFSGGSFVNSISSGICDGNIWSATTEIYVDNTLCGTKNYTIRQLGLSNSSCCEAFVMAAYENVGDYSAIFAYCNESIPEVEIGPSEIAFDGIFGVDNLMLIIYDQSRHYDGLLGCEVRRYEVESSSIAGVQVFAHTDAYSYYSDNEYTIEFNGFDVVIPPNTTPSDRSVTGTVCAYVDDDHIPCMKFNFNVKQIHGGADPYDYSDCKVVSGMITTNQTEDNKSCAWETLDCTSTQQGETIKSIQLYQFTQSGLDSHTYQTDYVRTFQYTLEETDANGNAISNGYTNIQMNNDDLSVSVYPTNQSGFCNSHQYDSLYESCGNCDVGYNAYKIYFKIKEIFVPHTNTTCYPNYGVSCIYYNALSSITCQTPTYRYSCYDSPLNYSERGNTIVIPSNEVINGGTVSAGTFDVKVDTGNSYTNHFEVDVYDQARDSQTGTYASDYLISSISTTSVHLGGGIYRHTIWISLNSNFNRNFISSSDYTSNLNLNVYLVNNDGTGQPTPCTGAGALLNFLQIP